MKLHGLFLPSKRAKKALKISHALAKKYKTKASSIKKSYGHVVMKWLSTSIHTAVSIRVPEEKIWIFSRFCSGLDVTVRYVTKRQTDDFVDRCLSREMTYRCNDI